MFHSMTSLTRAYVCRGIRAPVAGATRTHCGITVNRQFGHFAVAASARTSQAAFFGGAMTVAAAVWCAARSRRDNTVRAETAGDRFVGKVVVVTGAGGDFGRTGAALFKREGAHVVLLDAAPKPLEATEKALQKISGPEAFAVVCDITNQSQVDAAVASIERKFGKITHLWNNAGYQGLVKPTLEYSVEDFQRVQDINVVGAFRVLQAVAKSMQKTGGGVIVNTASVAGLRGTPAMPAYVASKAAVTALTMSVAKDLAPFNIRVNAVSPALIGPGFMWDRQNQLHAESGSPYFPSDPEVVAKNKVAGVPMKRLGSIDEVVKAVVFLLSEESSYCCGTNLIVDGGLAMR